MEKKSFITMIAVIITLIAVPLFADASEKDLLTAVKRGNLKEVKKLLEQGFSQEVVDDNGRNLLMVAAANNRLDVADFLVKNRANVNKRDNKGQTVLHLLAGNRSKTAPDLIAEAVRMGAYPKTADYEGFTPAGVAIKKGSSAAFKALLQSGLDKNDMERNQPLVLFAYSERKYDIVKLLVDSGADLNRKGTDGSTLLHLASAKNDRKLVDTLLGGNPDINQQNAEGKTPLMVAIENGNGKIAEIFIGRGPNYRISDRSGQGIAHYLASMKNATSLLEKIPEADLKINAKDNNARTPLAIAIAAKRWENLKFFTDKGADLNIRDGAGKTPVMTAAESEHLASVRLLLDAGAKTDIRDSNSRTILHYLAAMRGKKADEALSLSIEKCAEVNAKAANGSTPAGIAIEKRNESGFSILLKAGLDKGAKEFNTTPLVQYSYEKRQAAITRNLLESGAEINQKSATGETLLHLIAAADDQKFLEYVMKFNPDINAQDDGGRSPLMSAVENGKNRIASILIQKGADPMLKNRQGQNLFHYCAAKKGMTPLLAQFSDKIDIDAKDAMGRTPLAIAVHSNRPENVEFFLGKGASPDGRDHNGNPLVLIAYSTNRVMLNNFIAAGAKIDVKTNDNKDLLYLCLEQNDNALLKTLIGKGADVKGKRASGIYPLEYAVSAKQRANTETLLEAGADVSIRDGDGNPMIAISVQKKSPEITKLLLGKGVDANALSAEGKPVLELAYEHNRPDIFGMLVKAGAKGATSAKNGTPLVVVAAKDNREEFIEMLLEGGGDVMAKDAAGNPALVVAAREGSYQSVKTLLKKGAAVNATGENGDTALLKAIAASRNSNQTVQALLDGGADMNIPNAAGDAPLHIAVNSRNFNLFRTLLKKGADPNVKNKQGDTLILQLSAVEPPPAKGSSRQKLIAQNRDAMSIIKDLIKSNADPNTLNRFGETALNRARKKRNFDMISILLKEGANVNTPDKNGNTVLKKEIMDYIGDYRLVESSSKETRKIIDLFVASGGDINAADKFGRSALIHVTKEFNSRNERKVLDIIPYLFEKGARTDLKDKDGLTAKDYASRSRNSSLTALFSGR